MSIYITQQKKEELEATISQLERLDVFYKNNASSFNPNYVSNSTKLKIYKEILSEAIVLPVEESWDGTIDIVTTDVLENYPNGVIIKPKES